jgi:hypothetical protein
MASSAMVAVVDNGTYGGTDGRLRGNSVLVELFPLSDYSSDWLRGLWPVLFSPSSSRFVLLWFMLFAPRHLHAMNPLLPRCSFRANSFDYYQLAHGHPNTYTYAVRYITTRRPPAHGEEGHNPTEAQSRFSRRDAHSTPAHRRFQIHQEPFQPAFRCAQNPQEERPRGAHHHEFQNQGRAGTASCVL